MSKNVRINKKSSIKTGPHTWYLLTNHQNLLYMFAAGMILGREGFKEKYYSDPSIENHGFIKLFRNKNDILPRYVKTATEEREGLLPCIVPIDLSKFETSCKILTIKNSQRKEDSPRFRKRPNDIAILVNAPLPLTLLRSINVSTKVHEEGIRTTANDFNNVDLSQFEFEINVAPELFSFDDKGQPSLLPEESSAIKSEKDNSLDESSEKVESYIYKDAYGGMLAMLYHSANRNDIAAAAFRIIANVERDEDKALVNNIHALTEILTWIKEREISEKAAPLARIYWGVVRSILDEKKLNSSKNRVDVVLSELVRQRSEIREEKHKNSLDKLIPDIQSCNSFNGKVLSELFEQHTGPLSRSLLLFCVKGSSVDLLEYFYEDLKDEDFLLASILFGVQDGWIRMGKELRTPELAEFVSHMMVCFEGKEHPKLSNPQLKSIRAPKRPIPFRELFMSTDSSVDERHQDIAIELVEKCKWEDCLNTTFIFSGEGLEPADRTLSSLELKFPGKVEVETKVELDNKSFFKRLSGSYKIDLEIEQEIRSKLTS